MADMNAIEKRLADAMDKEGLRYTPQYGLFYEEDDCASLYPCRHGAERIGDNDEGYNVIGLSCFDGPSSDGSGYCQWYVPDYFRYRLDFAIREDDLKIAVEVDGLEFHSTASQLAADLKRQREIEKAGWTFLRFKASDVYSHADRCARKIGKLVGDMGKAKKQRQQGSLLNG
jgi:hypothetical protein